MIVERSEQTGGSFVSAAAPRGRPVAAARATRLSSQPSRRANNLLLLALIVAALFAVMAANQAPVLGSPLRTDRTDARWGSEDAVAGRQASELFLEYLASVIAKR